MRRTTPWRALLACALLGLAPAPAAGQDLDEAVRQITRDESLRLQRETPRQPAPDRAAREAAEDRSYFGELPRVRHGTETGGWVSGTWLYLNQIDHQKRTVDPITRVLVADTRAWVSHRQTERQAGYFRLRKLQLAFEAAPGVRTLDERTKEQLDVDLAFYDFPLGKTQVRVGRAFFTVGRGLVLAESLDGGVLSRRFGKVDVSAFAGTSLKRQDNLDTRVIGFDRGHNDRDYVGLEASRTLPGGTYLYGYGVSNIDQTRSEDAAQDFLDFQYQSHYVGGGVERGFGRLHLNTEAVAEGGSSRGLDGRARIDAWALLSSALYRFPGRGSATATLDFAFGSGDANRRSVTSSFELGPRAAAGDQNFLYFGQWDGGLALSPRLSNLEVWRAGMRGRPLERTLLWPSDLLAGFKASIYHKDVARGGISDPLATQARAHVGSALDLFASCKVFSDLNVLLEYGTFKPADAYPVDARDLTTRFAATTTLSF